VKSFPSPTPTTYRILTNQAKRRGQREARSIPFAAFSARADADDGEPAVTPERFIPAGDERAGHWVSYPQNWRETPEERFLSHETRAMVQQAIAALPFNQRIVITLRDVEGFPSRRSVTPWRFRKPISGSCCTVRARR
jgi:RNA polymerase sigma-70 factor (ECF subfamily)